MDNCSDLMDRLERLEKAHQQIKVRFRLLLSSAVAAGLGIVLMGATSVSSFDSLRLRHLIIEDERGHTRVTIGVLPDGSATQQFYDNDGKTQRVEFGITSDHASRLRLLDERGKIRSSLYADFRHNVDGQPRTFHGLILADKNSFPLSTNNITDYSDGTSVAERTLFYPNHTIAIGDAVSPTTASRSMYQQIPANSSYEINRNIVSTDGFTDTTWYPHSQNASENSNSRAVIISSLRKEGKPQIHLINTLGTGGQYSSPYENIMYDTNSVPRILQSTTDKSAIFEVRDAHGQTRQLFLTDNDGGSSLVTYDRNGSEIIAFGNDPDNRLFSYTKKTPLEQVGTWIDWLGRVVTTADIANRALKELSPDDNHHEK